MSEFSEGEKKEPVFSDPDVSAEVMAWAVEFKHRLDTVSFEASEALYDEEEKAEKDPEKALALALVKKLGEHATDTARDMLRRKRQEKEMVDVQEKAEAILKLPLAEQQASRMNILTNEAGVIGALAELEGHYWATDSSTSDQSHNIRRVIEQLKAGKTGGGVDSIYGNGGYNRYMVDDDGSVRISLHHISKGIISKYYWYIVKAKELGFGIFR